MFYYAIDKVTHVEINVIGGIWARIHLVFLNAVIHFIHAMPTWIYRQVSSKHKYISTKQWQFITVQGAFAEFNHQLPSLVSPYCHYLKKNPSVSRLTKSLSSFKFFFFFNCSRRNPSLRRGSERGHRYLSSPTSSTVSSRPRGSELSSTDRSMGNCAHRQMQYFPAYFCQSSGLLKTIQFLNL